MNRRRFLTSATPITISFNGPAHIPAQLAGEIDFPACHRALKSIGFKGWICVDLDTAREPIYA